MDNYVCHHCMWEGTQEELKVSMDSNPFNRQDHSLYENLVCPDCNTNEQLVNIDEERRYEDEAHRNFYQNEI
jgi:rubredoxin